MEPLKHMWQIDERILFKTVSDGHVSLIDHNNLSEAQTMSLLIICEQVLEYEEYLLYPHYITDIDRHKLAIVVDNKVVGILTPKPTKQADDYWRVGTTFISPSARGKGISTKAITLLSKQGYKLKAWIYDENIASQKSYERAGFIKNEPKVVDGDDGHMYYCPLPIA